MTGTKHLRLSASAALLAAGALAPAVLATAPASAAESDENKKCDGRKKYDMWINVIAQDVRSSNGRMAVTIYPDKQSKFLASGGDINVAKVDATKGETRMKVCLPGPGVYGVAIYHDENGNGKFDRGLLPKEGYGFSNNPSTLAGLPLFKSVRIAVPKNNLTTRIDITYP